MRLSQKRRCGECKALRVDVCDLGHEIKVSKRCYGIPTEFTPLEPCYKPLTNAQWCEAQTRRVADRLRREGKS